MSVLTDGSIVTNGFAVSALGAHHDGSALFVPEDTPAQGDVVPVRVRVPSGTRVRVPSGTGVALQMTYVGSPMICSGEELGFEGRDGEDARRPIPGHRRADWDTETLWTFKDLIAIRNFHPAPRRGGLRWVIAADDALGYLRETADERILVVVSRSPRSGALSPASLLRGGQAETLYGETDLGVAGGALVIPGDGPGVGIWRLS